MLERTKGREVRRTAVVGVSEYVDPAKKIVDELLSRRKSGSPLQWLTTAEMHV